MPDRDQGFTDSFPDDRDDAEFLARVTAPLRTPETLDPSFEGRVMAVARAEAPRLYPRPSSPWWRRPRTVRLSPLAGLALAAGFAGIVCLATLAAAGRFGGSDRPEVAEAGAPILVRFVLEAPDARSVALVGDFNAWMKEATPLRTATVPGVWTVSVPLTAGRHEYAFIVDGERWVIDPFAPRVSDDFGTESSVLTVGTGATAM